MERRGHIGVETGCDIERDGEFRMNLDSQLSAAAAYAAMAFVGAIVLGMI